MNESIIRQLKHAPILVAGDVMVDEYIMGDVERISPESPVPVLVARDRLRRLGGAGNVVRNLMSMGGQVALFAAAGKDGAGRWFRQHCEEMGVDTFWLKEDPGRPTTIKTRVVARNQQIVRIDEEHIGEISPEIEASVLSDLKSVMPQVKAVIVSDYGKGFLTGALLRTLLDQAHRQGIPVLVDPKGMDYRKYEGAAYITPNVREASLASGIEIRTGESLEQAGKVLLEHARAKGIIITRGKEGITLVAPGRTANFPVKPVEIVDVTGAGDTVIATAALAVASGLSIDNAIELANLAASLVVARFGAAAVTPEEMIAGLNDDKNGTKLSTAEEIGALLRNHRIHGHRVVFTNGCFDLFHAGHLEILRRASAMGDVLVVGINSDRSISRIKGPGRPIVPEMGRVELVSALNFVNYVVLFNEDTPLKLIERVCPDVLVKGEDWKGRPVVGEEIVKARGGTVEFVRLVKGISTTDLINRIRGTANGNPET